MKTVWKLSLAIVDKQAIRVPRGSKMLTVQLQYGTPQLWYQCDPEAELTDLVVYVAGTGHVRPDLEHVWYIGSVMMAGDSLVFHVFSDHEIVP